MTGIRIIGNCRNCGRPVRATQKETWCHGCYKPLPDEINETLEQERLEQEKKAQEADSSLWTCTCGYNVQGHLETCWNCGAKNPNPVLPQKSPIMLTTAPALEGYRVIETLDIITAECAVGMNIFRDFLAGIRDLVGGRSETTQNALREARRVCLAELRKEAQSLGANAVIAVDLDYSEFSGGGKSMLFLVASGTAVRVSAVESDQGADQER